MPDENNNLDTAQIAEELGISALPQEQQDQLIAQFGELALKAATVAVLEKMPNGRQEEFARIAESGDGDALKAFLDRELPGHEQIAQEAVAKEVADFRVALAEADMDAEDAATEVAE